MEFPERGAVGKNKVKRRIRREAPGIRGGWPVR